MQPIDLVYRSARRHPDAVAVRAPGATLTYAELVTRADAVAAGLQGIDPRPGSRVGVCAHNTLEHLLALLGVMAADKVWVPLNPLDSAADLRAKIDAARPSIVVIESESLERIGPLNDVVTIAADAETGASPHAVAGLVCRHRGEAPARGRLAADRPQAIKFTGGSSGGPKGVIQPYRAWIAGASSMIHAFGFDARDRFLAAAPLTHGTSCYVTPLLAAGGALVLPGGKATPANVLESFAELDVTATFVPPTLVYMLMREMDGRAGRFPALRLLIYGGAGMPVERIREAQAMFGPVLATNYGLTEAPQIITALTPVEALEPANAASVGTPSFMTRVEVVDAQGRFLPAGEQGEIVVEGDLVMSGYLDAPEQTAEALVDGWLHTGDVGYLDERGYLFLKDRLKDVIITGGFNVYPSDVEAALVAHPAVHECVVFGLADEKWGEAVHAAVELRPGARASDAEIIAFAREHVGPVKAPKRVHFFETLPRSAVGKVQRREVKALAARKGNA